MKNRHRIKMARMIVVMTVTFLAIAGAGLFMGRRYISRQLLHANENVAVDLALLVKNNFQITDAEVAYMKTLSFNEMEVDPINNRLMDVGNGVRLNTQITNVYLIAPLREDEIKYTTDAETSQFFGYEQGTPLDGVWLLNGIIGDDGHFIPKQREDIYRYTHLTESQRLGMEQQTAFGEYCSDAWGSFITGYAPIYTVEGHFVGLIGIDMNPDKYQSSAQGMVLALLAALCTVSVTMMALFLYFYFKSIRAREGQLYFEFYSRMSHDMRTPMNGILGMAALSKDENDLAVLHHNFARVEEAGHYMLGLINDTLDIQKLDAGRLRLDPKVRHCRELLDSLAAMVQPDADKKHIHLDILNKNTNLDCYCRIDELRVQQIFMNIVSNAIKFTPEGGTVQFSVERLGTDGAVCHDKFQIRDTGIGMSEKFIREHLFQPFEQEQNSLTTQYGGSGLGLSIVKNLITLMGGRIEVESQLGKGTTFTVYLDLTIVDPETAEKEQKPVAAAQDVKNALRGRHILLCEDHPLNAEIAVRLLERAGCAVTVAHNGKEGVEEFSHAPAETYDAILMDIRMPVMDGLTAARQIRALPRPDAAGIPVIAMTANAYPEDIQNCRDAGMNAHLVKPIDPETMYRVIAENLLVAKA